MIQTLSPLRQTSLFTQISTNSDVSAKIVELILSEIVKINDASSIKFTGTDIIRY
jgi:hypothetical protein